MLSSESLQEVDWEIVDDFVDTSIEMLLSEGKINDYSILKEAKELRLKGSLTIMEMLQTTCICLYDYPEMLLEYQQFFTNDQIQFHNDINRDGEFSQILISIAADLSTSTSAAAVIINKIDGITQCTVIL